MNDDVPVLPVPDSELDDLRRRLRSARWPDAETAPGWSQGVPLAWLRDLARYWAEDYDWRPAERRLLAEPQQRIDIDGLPIHFLHRRSPHAGALPLLVTHGWPQSVLEFVDVLDALTDPADPADAFDVVCVSLPGHGLSGRPNTPGWTIERIAAAWAELMAKLGYGRYGAHGQDWGSFITARLGSAHPEPLVGVHVTMAFAAPPQQQVALDERDIAGLAALKEFQRTESGYSAIQSTRPQTLGYGLTDSPIGLLAWIAEKYWSWSDHDGDLEKAIGRDRLLDTVTLYWLTGTATSAARLYWESYQKMPMDEVAVPSAVTVFPKDARMPRPWIEGRFTDLRQWRDQPHGGHFPALEQPAALVEDLRSFFRPLR